MVDQVEATIDYTIDGAQVSIAVGDTNPTADGVEINFLATTEGEGRAEYKAIATHPDTGAVLAADETGTGGIIGIPPRGLTIEVSDPPPTVDVAVESPPGVGVGTATIPMFDPVEPSVDAACDFDGAEINVGDSVTIPVDVTAGDGDTSTEATVEIEVAGQTASETVTLEPNGSARVEATYEIADPGEYTPEITLS